MYNAYLRSVVASAARSDGKREAVFQSTIPNDAKKGRAHHGINGYDNYLEYVCIFKVSCILENGPNEENLLRPAGNIVDPHGEEDRPSSASTLVRLSVLPIFGFAANESH